MSTVEGIPSRQGEQGRTVSTSRATEIRLPRLGKPQLRLGALLAVGLAAFLVGWLVLHRDDDTAQPAAPGASAASEGDLRALAASSPAPVYWAGPKEGFTYELTKTTDGRVYVRYLPEGTEIGTPRSTFLTIGTYPRPRAFAELQRAGRAKGALSLKIENGGLAVLSQGRSSVYFGYPDARYQVEVYHPSPDEARRLALSGQVVPVK